MLTITEQAAQFVAQMNQALDYKGPDGKSLVPTGLDDKEGHGRRLMGLLRGADTISAVLQQSAMVGLGVLAIASAGIPGELRCETEEIGSGIERHFVFYRDTFRIGSLILTQSGTESGKVGGGVTINIDEATIVWPNEPKFSSN